MPESIVKKASIKLSGKVCFAVLLTILLLISTLPTPTISQANSNLKDVWQEIISAPTTSTDTLQPVIDQFINKQHQSNIENASIYSLALLKIARRGNLQPSVKELLTTAAITISPDYSFPETAYSRLMFQQHSYLKSLASLFRAIRKFRSNPLEHLYASTFFWLTLAFTPLILLLLSSLCLTVKYYRAFCEMGNLKLTHKMKLIIFAASVTAAIIIIVLPAPLLGLLLLSVAIALLATKRDIITLTLLVISLLIVPLAYEKGMASLLALDSSFFKAARYSSSGIDNQSNEAYLRQPAINQSQLTLQLFSQAESARQRQEYAKAEVFLKKIISNRIKIGAVYNNLANIYILQDRYQKSTALFLKAAKLEKNSGIPYYNLSRAYIQQDFDLKKSSQALEMAFKRDPNLSITQVINNNSESELQTGARLLFMSLPDDFYRRYADTQSDKNVYLPEFLKQALFYGANKTLYLLLVILSICGLLYLFYTAPSNRRICSDCGRLFHPTQESNQKSKKKRCPICYMDNRSRTSSLFKTLWETTSHPQVRLSAISVATISILIPGFYSLLIGNTLMAAGLMIPATLWFCNLLICKTTIMAPFPPSSPWFIVILPFIIWFANIVVLAALMTSQQWRHKFSRNSQ